MLQFVAGFMVAVSIVTLVALFLLKSKTRSFDIAGKARQTQLEELSKLTGGLAHEIKNPLSTIKVNLKLISEQMDRGQDGIDRAVRKISVVQKETDRLEQILEDFLGYIGKPEPQFADIDINELIDDMVDFYSPQAYTGSITIRVGFYSDKLICKVDTYLLKQAILNLFINAQQAMDAGGEIIVRTDKQKNNAIIEISDTGKGIEPDKLTRVFDAYYSSKSRGSGLGLPTTRKIIEAHNGGITLNSEPGKGTSFIIKLPLQLQD